MRQAARRAPAGSAGVSALRRAISEAWGIPLLALGACLLGLAVRLPFLGVESGDYRNYVEPWFRTLQAEGHTALGTQFSDYSPAYLHLLWAATYLPLPALAAVKAVSLCFDVLLAVAAAYACRTAGSSPRTAGWVFAAVILAPTVVLNSAAWGQCDAIYTSFAVLAIGFVVAGRPGLAMLAFGAAFAFKAQAAFLLPLLVVASFRGVLPWRNWLLAPLPFCAFAVIPILAGYPPRDLALVYLSQSEKYQQLTLNAPTLFAFVNARESIGQPAMYAGGAAILGLTFAAARWARLSERRDWLTLAALFAVFVPFVLPRMHERYFFAADVLAITCFALGSVRWWVPAAIITASLCSYLPFLFGFEILPLWACATLMAIALTSLTVRTFPQVERARAWATGLVARHRAAAVRFAAVGVASSIAFLVLYLVLRVSLGPASANLVALGLTMGFNFQANRSWSFRGRTRALKVEAPAFLVVYGAGLLASAIALDVALRVAGPVSRPVEVLLVFGASGVATITRFWLLTLVVYRRPLNSAAPRLRAGADLD